jgi:hypothetical protein
MPRPPIERIVWTGDGITSLAVRGAIAGLA